MEVALGLLLLAPTLQELRRWVQEGPVPWSLPSLADRTQVQLEILSLMIS